MKQDSELTWPQLMRFGMSVLRLSPKDFWAMSVPELRAAAGGNGTPAAHTIPHTVFADLVQKYPDKETK